MKIFVAGGTGRVATELIKNLLADGHEIVAGSRHPENVIEKDNERVTSVKLDLTQDADELAKVVGDVDVIYFVAGSRGKGLLQTDAFGAVKLMWVAEQQHVERFVMLSSLHSLEPKKWHEGSLSKITDYNIAKFFADNYLMESTKLNYTIIQPTSLTEEPATGKIMVNDVHVATNPIPDVAKVLADVLKYPNTGHKVIEMASGDLPIADALKKI